jgi:hypothetical protein
LLIRGKLELLLQHSTQLIANFMMVLQRHQEPIESLVAEHAQLQRPIKRAPSLSLENVRERAK